LFRSRRISSSPDPKHPHDLPHRGNFGWQPLVSAFERTLEYMMSDRSYFGMQPEALYLWARSATRKVKSIVR
jgi:hypothetical protein